MLPPSKASKLGCVVSSMKYKALSTTIKVYGVKKILHSFPTPKKKSQRIDSTQKKTCFYIYLYIHIYSYISCLYFIVIINFIVLYLCVKFYCDN